MMCRIALLWHQKSQVPVHTRAPARAPARAYSTFTHTYIHLPTARSLPTEPGKHPAAADDVQDRILVAPKMSGASPHTCTLHAHLHVHIARSHTHRYTHTYIHLPTARSLPTEPGEQTARERADANNTGDDSDSSEDLNDFQVPRPSLINTKPHAAILIGRRE